MPHGEEVVACVATMPCRAAQLEVACASLLPQVDRMFIYFNDYTEEQVPEWAVCEPSITWVTSNECPYGDLGDVGKFFFCSQEMKGVFGISGDVFTFDDDIVYPEWYVEQTRQKLSEDSLSSSILSYHGAILQKRCTEYHLQKKLFEVKGDVSSLTKVHVGGTGCMSFRSSLFSPSLKMFKHTNMADIFIAKWAKENGVEINVLPHRKGDFRILLEAQNTIYEATHHKDGSERDRSAEIKAIVSSIIWDH
tara:strand:+ start:4424 stop:5173 length:750 start_codon:yes stop_codon:yes gene_type:complete